MKAVSKTMEIAFFLLTVFLGFEAVKVSVPEASGVVLGACGNHMPIVLLESKAFNFW